MEYFDSHAHYDDEKFDGERDEIIKKVHDFGVTTFVSAGYSLAGSKKGLELAKKYPFIYTTLGISPNDVTENWHEEVNELEKILLDEGFVANENYQQEFVEKNENKKNSEKIKLIQEKSRKIIAIGEIGLDYHYDVDRNLQKEAFISQIELANKFGLPIVIHTRDAVMDTLEILKNHPVLKKGIFHCCPLNRELVKEGLKLGFYISFAGVITFKNAKNAEEIVKMVPDDRFLIETDSPYLSPEPRRGTRNDSRNLEFIVKKIAKFKGQDPEDVARQSYNNAKRIYEIS